MNRFSTGTNGLSAINRLAIAMILLSVATGCNTLSSLGLPFGSSSNKLINSAKQISEAPGQSLLLPKELTKQPLGVYIVDVGDSILVEPVKFDATIRLPSDQIVQPDGHISLGEFGRIYVADKTIDEIQIEVQATIDEHLRSDFHIAYEVERREREQQNALEKRANAREKAKRKQLELTLGGRDDAEEKFGLTDTDEPSSGDLSLGSFDDEEERLALERRIGESIVHNEISVRLVNWDSKKIYVLGEVNSPGAFTFLGNETVLDALIEAGGINEKANRHQIVVSRPSTCSSCRTVMKVCYDQLVQLGDASTNYQLQPGDRVFVPSLTFKDDLRMTLKLDKNDRCPRCANCPQACDLPEGCE